MEGEDSGWARVRRASLPFGENRNDVAIRGLAVPALGALLMDPVMSLVDTAMVGWLVGGAGVGGLGVSGVVFSLCFSLFNFVSSATNPLVAEAAAADADDGGHRASAAAAAGLHVGWALGAAAGVAVYAGARFIVSAMGASGEVMPHALAYLRVRVTAAPAVLTQLACVGALRGHQDTRSPLSVALAANVLHLVLDVAFIGWLGWGVAGAAAATAVSQWVSAALLVAIMVRSGRLRPRDAFGRVSSWSAVRPLVEAGAALSTRTLSSLSAVTFATSTAALLGTTVVAAHEIVRQLWLFHVLALQSLGVAGQTLVAKHLARRQGSRAVGAVDRLLFLGLVAGMSTCGILVLGGSNLVDLFTADASVRDLARSVVPLVGVLQPLVATVFVMDAALIGARENVWVARTMVASAALAWAGLSVVRHLGLGLHWIWLSLHLMVLGRGMGAFFRYASAESRFVAQPVEPGVLPPSKSF